MERANARCFSMPTITKLKNGGHGAKGAPLPALRLIDFAFCDGLNLGWHLCNFQRQFSCAPREAEGFGEAIDAFPFSAGYIRSFDQTSNQHPEQNAYFVVKSIVDRIDFAVIRGLGHDP